MSNNAKKLDEFSRSMMEDILPKNGSIYILVKGAKIYIYKRYDECIKMDPEMNGIIYEVSREYFERVA